MNRIKALEIGMKCIRKEACAMLDDMCNREAKDNKKALLQESELEKAWSLLDEMRKEALRDAKNL